MNDQELKELIEKDVNKLKNMSIPEYNLYQK